MRADEAANLDYELVEGRKINEAEGAQKDPAWQQAVGCSKLRSEELAREEYRRGRCELKGARCWRAGVDGIGSCRHDRRTL